MLVLTCSDFSMSAHINNSGIPDPVFLYNKENKVKFYC